MSLSSVVTGLANAVQSLKDEIAVIQSSKDFATKGDILVSMYGKSISFAKLVALYEALQGGASSVSYSTIDTSKVDLSGGCTGKYNMPSIYETLYNEYRDKITDFDQTLIIKDNNNKDETDQFWAKFATIQVMCDGYYPVIVVETNETSSGLIGFKIVDRETQAPATAVYGSVKLYTVPKLDEDGKVIQGASVAELRGFGKAVDGEVLFARGFFSPSFLFSLGSYKGRLEAQLYAVVPS